MDVRTTTTTHFFQRRMPYTCSTIQSVARLLIYRTYRKDRCIRTLFLILLTNMTHFIGHSGYPSPQNALWFPGGTAPQFENH